MRALVRAELVKLRSTRAPAWLVLATVAMMAFAITVNVPTADGTISSWSVDDPAILAHLMGDIFGIAEVTMVLLGVLVITQEHRYGTITGTYLVEPRRERVLIAKSIALVLTSVVVTAVGLAATCLAGVVLLNTHDGTVTFGADLFELAAGAFLVMALYAIIGLAVGALVRNQIVAVVGALLWLLLIERVFVQSLPAIGRWMLLGATNGLLQLQPADGPTLLSPAIGGLLVVIYAAALGALALVVTPRRDVL